MIIIMVSNSKTIKHYLPAVTGFRSDSEHVRDVFKPFDWTFTTHYKGTLLRDGEKAFTVCI